MSLITIKQAKELFNKKYPNLKIQKGFILTSGGKRYYLFLAPESNEDYDAPYYAVDVNDGTVSSYSPMADFENFKMIGKHPIKV